MFKRFDKSCKQQQQQKKKKKKKMEKIEDENKRFKIMQ